MNLSFETLGDLDEFLQWARRYGIAHAMSQGFTPPAAPAPETPYPTIDPSTLPEAGAAGGVAFDTPPRMPPPVSGDPSGACLQPAPEPTKRKRRTKAEIEADAAAQAEAEKVVAGIAAAGNVQNFQGKAVVAPSGDSAEAAKAADSAQDPNAPKPEGANPFEQAATSAPAAQAEPDAPAETAAPDEPDADTTVVTPFQHITRARAFIAKHGTTKYSESFVLAGLDANVMAYNAEQRAQHVAVLDTMDQG